jgi:hypothetical protein
MQNHEYPIQRVIDSLTESATRDEDDDEHYHELVSRALEVTYLVKHSADGTSQGVQSVDVTIGIGGPTEWLTFTQDGSGYHAEAWSSWAPDSPGRIYGELADTLADVWGVDYLFETGADAERAGIVDRLANGLFPDD